MIRMLGKRSATALLVIAIQALVVQAGICVEPVPSDPPLSEEIIQAREHLGNGDFTNAAETLERYLASSNTTEADSRYAYNILVFIRLQTMQVQQARESAREALTLFPDIEADLSEFPVTVNDTYDEIRATMFGSLAVTQPEEGQVYLDGELMGEAPLMLEYVLGGSHDLKLSKPGYLEYTTAIEIVPGETLRLEPDMSKDRGFGWYATRIGLPVLAVGVTSALIATSGDDGGSGSTEPTTLPEPPPPPQ